jgi:hypothetical protein
MRTIYWGSDCGHEGSIQTRAEALAPLVREARKDHDRRFPKCDMVDIETLETKEERARRLNPQPTREQLGEGFC